MADPLRLAKAAREQLAKALNALQSNDQLPESVLDELGAPIAQAMGILHRIERSGGAELDGRDTVLSTVREALDQTQTLSEQYSSIDDEVVEAVALALSKANALARYKPPEPEPAPAPKPVVVEPAPKPVVVEPAPKPVVVEPAPKPVVAEPAPKPAPQPVIAEPVIQPMRIIEPAPAPEPAPVAAPAPAPEPAPAPVAEPAPAPAPVAEPALAPAPAPAVQTETQQLRKAPTGPLIDVELGIHSASNFYKGLSGNDVIEHGGIFVATYKIPKLGSTVNLRVLLPGNYEFLARAVVQWTRDGSDSVDPGFGARFSEISSDGRQLVYRYARNREPIFYDDL